MRCLKIYLNALLALGHKSLIFSKIKTCSKQCHLIQEKPFKLDFHKVTLSQKKALGKNCEGGEKSIRLPDEILNS